jgi:YVTN family beta-propeller protein
MNKLTLRVAPLALAGLLAGCGQPAEQKAEAPAYRLYVTNEIAGTVTVIDEPSHTVVATVPLGKRPRGMQATADGRQIFVALSGSPIAGPGVDEDKLPPKDPAADGVGVLNTVSLKLARILKGIANPEQLAMAQGRIYSASEETELLSILDAASGNVLGTVPTGEEPEGVAVSADGKTAYVTVEGDDTVAVIDTATAKVVKRIKVGDRPRSMTLSPNGAHAYVTDENGATLTEIDTATQAVTRTVPVPGEGAKPMGVVVSPDSKRIYVTTGRGGQLVAFDAATLVMQKAVPVGARPWGVAVSPDGKLIYTANGQSDDVSVVDAATMTVITKLKSAGRPWGVVVAPKCCG